MKKIYQLITQRYQTISRLNRWFFIALSVIGYFIWIHLTLERHPLIIPFYSMKWKALNWFVMLFGYWFGVWLLWELIVKLMRMKKRSLPIPKRYQVISKWSRIMAFALSVIGYFIWIHLTLEKDPLIIPFYNIEWKMLNLFIMLFGYWLAVWVLWEVVVRIVKHVRTE